MKKVHLSLHASCREASHPCFRCKMAIWRLDGAPGVHIPQGWRGPSVQARARQELEDGRKNGRQLESTTPMYSGPVSV